MGTLLKFHVKPLGLMVCILSLTLAFGWVFAAENKGAKEIQLNGGTRGPVPFPHERHQEVVGDCRACHDLFPQEPGAIDSLKSQEKLAQQQVMNKLCLQCHRAKKAAGKTKYGPLTCSQCHQR